MINNFASVDCISTIDYNNDNFKSEECSMEICRLNIGEKSDVVLVLHHKEWPIYPVNKENAKKIKSITSIKKWESSFHIFMYNGDEFTAMFHLNKNKKELAFFTKINENTTKEQIWGRLFRDEEFYKFFSENCDKSLYDKIKLFEKLNVDLSGDNKIVGSIKKLKI